LLALVFWFVQRLLKGEQMTFKSRLMFGLVFALVLLMAQSTFAQINLSLIPDASSGEVQTNRNAQTATPDSSGSGVLISGQLIANSVLTTTTLRISYPSPITSSPASFALAPSIPTNDPIRIEGASGVFASVTNGSLTLNTTNSRIEILLPGLTQGGVNSQSGSFRVVGVRIDANGKTGAQSITASLDSSANNYILTTPGPITVISTLGPGIGSMAIGSGGGQTNNASATIFTNRTLPDATGSIVINEGIASAWRTATQSSNSGTAVTNGTQIRLTFSGVPAGVTLTLAAVTGGNPAPPTISLSNTSVTASSTTSIISFTGTSSTTASNLKPSLTSVNYLQIDYTVNALSTTAAVTTPGSITVTATMYPIGDGVNNDDSAHLGLPRQDQGYPTFAQADVGPVTIVNIVPASTTLLIPLVEKVGVFDTGISIANTTSDPFGSGGGGATASAGTLKFDFFPATATGAGTACTLTTSSTSRPGFGIASDGTVPAGSTFVALLSQLLPASNCAAGDFVGYVFVTANFLNAHGQATISDFRTYSLATNVLVLPPPATSPRSNPGGSAEQLSF
jgi:hypothetical protein